MTNANGSLEALLAKLLDDTLNDRQRQQLSALLRDDKLARREYLEMIATHAALRDELGKPVTPVTSSVSARGASLRQTAAKASHFFRRPTPFSITVAALVMGLLVTAMALMVPPFYRAIVRRDDNNVDPQRVVAELTGLHEAVWANEQAAMHVGTYLSAGRSLELSAGLAQITFDSGAEMIVAGPARFTVVAENEGQFDFGRLTARVPQPATGFSITTPTATVVDLGTEYQMAVEPSGAEQLYVFDGLVRVSDVEPTASRKFQDVHAGQGLQWTAQEPARDYTPTIHERFATLAGQVRPDATVLFFDNFNTSDTDNFDGAPLTGRRGGLLKDDVVLRSARTQQAIADQCLRMVLAPDGAGRIRFHDATSSAWYDWAAGSGGKTITSAGKLRIDFLWIAPDEVSDNWLSFNIGHPGSSLAEPATRVNHAETDYGILLRGNGGTQRFDNGVGVTTESFAASTERRHVIIELTFDSFDDGANVDVTVTVAGKQADHHTFTWHNNSGQLYMELGTLETGMLIDNLRLVAIHKAAPEISSPREAHRE